MALENFPKLLDLDTPARPAFSSPIPGYVPGVLPPHTGPIVYPLENISAPVGPVGASKAPVVLDEAYKFLGLEPTHGGYLPKGITPFAATYFVPQPIGFVDPSVYGLHHDWLLGVTYDRLAMLYLDPEELARKIEEQKGIHQPAAGVKPIRGPQGIALFDYPFLIAGGGIDYTSTNTAPPQMGGTITDADRARFTFETELVQRLSTSQPGLYPVVFPTGERVIFQVQPDGSFVPVGTLILQSDGSFKPVLVKPTNLLAAINGANAKPPNDQMITERADP